MAVRSDLLSHVLFATCAVCCPDFVSPAPGSDADRQSLQIFVCAPNAALPYFVKSFHSIDQESRALCEQAARAVPLLAVAPLVPAPKRQARWLISKSKTSSCARAMRL